MLYAFQSVLDSFSSKSSSPALQSPPILSPVPLILSDERQFLSPLREEASPLQQLQSSIVMPTLSPVFTDTLSYSPDGDDVRDYDRIIYADNAQEQPIVLAGDDILPAIVCVLVKACPKHLHTISFYIDNFLFFDISSTPLGYIHVSLKAALEFIDKTYNSLPEEKRRKVDETMLEDEEDEDEEELQCEGSSPFPRQRKASVPPPLMNTPSATTKPSPLPGANTKSFSGTPEICVGEDPRQNTKLNSFMKNHERMNKIEIKK